MTSFREGERFGDDREKPYLHRRMTPEEVNDFVREIGEDFKEYLKSPERKRILEEITGKTEQERSFEKLVCTISAVDDASKTITEQYPDLLTTEEIEDFLSECSGFIGKIESRLKPRKENDIDESEETGSDSSDKPVEVCKCYPHIWGTIIDSYSELEELIRSETVDYHKTDGYEERMKEAYDHFQLLKELPTNITPKEVRGLSKKLEIDENDAVDWIISSNRPLIYEQLEEEFPWGISDSLIKRIRNPFDREDPDIDWPW